MCIFIILSLSMETIEKKASDKKVKKHFFESFKKKKEKRECVCVSACMYRVGKRNNSSVQYNGGFVFFL